MRFKAAILDEAQMRRALIRMSHEIIEKNRGIDNVVLIGIQRRGVPLAQQIAEIIKTVEGSTVPVGFLDITLYRDDLSLISEHPQIKSTDLPFSITNANVILVDDVLYTGRTTRAAMEALSENGRPKTVQLAVLIDRGGRELPIGADYVGKVLPCSKDEIVSVNVAEIDKVNSVEIYCLND